MVGYDGKSSTLGPADRFTYQGAPTVSGVAPMSGPAGGGTPVTITGTGFATAPGATGVAFGSVAAGAVSCASATTCVATAPAFGGGGTEVVTVSVAGQASPVSFAAPVFTFGPAGSGGPAAGGHGAAAATAAATASSGTQLGLDLPLPSAYQQWSVTDNGPNLGWTVAAPGSLTGDGYQTYLAGTPFWNNPSTGNIDEGLLFAF